MGSWTLLGILAFYFFTSIPAFQGAGAWVARGLSFWKSNEKKAVSLRIEKTLNSVQNEIDREAKGVIPYSAKVEWIDKPSYLDTSEEIVVIRMKEHEENPRNVAFAVVDYVTKGMIPFSRLYIERPIQTAVDTTMIRRMLHERDESALDYYLTNVLSKKKDDEELQRYLKVLDNLEQQGLFTRIYLEEVKEVGLKMYPMEDQYAVRETKEMLKHLDILARRKQGQKGAANPYIGKRIKVAYILIAESERLLFEGSKPQVQYGLKCLENGCEAIYLLSRGAKTKYGREVANELARKGNMRIVSSSEYEQTWEKGKTKTLCVQLRSNHTSEDVISSNKET
jgi:hypothetical protein